MSDVAEFVLARIAEDEAVARAAAKRPIVARGKWGLDEREQPRVDAVGVVWYRHDDGWSGSDSGTFKEGDALFARFDPDRVLAECEAKRQLIDKVFRYEAKIDGEWGCSHSAEAIAAGMCDETPVNEIKALRLLALPYADHADYDPSWRP